MVGLVNVERREDRRPWGLIVVCLLAASVGIIGLPLQIATYNLAGTASREDVQRARLVTEQLARLEAEAALNVEQHRVANDEAHAEQCRIILDIAKAAEIDVEPCEFERLERRERPRPLPAPAPTP